MRRVSNVAGLLVSLLLVAGVGLMPSAGRAEEPFTIKWVDLTSRDGLKLGANVVIPTTPGKHPLIVIPGSWGGGNTQNLLWSTNLAKRGMIAVNYATRGAGDSGGTIDMVGPKDTQDLQDVIDWSLANTPADPKKVGIIGISYSGPIILNAAAVDPRIKAVASTSGMMDMEDMFFPNETRYGLLAFGFRLTGFFTTRSGQDFHTRMDDFFANRNIPEMRQWAWERSPVSRIDAINRSGTAVLMTQAWSDSVIRTKANMAFWEKLTVPKRFEIYPGEHASTEITGGLSLPFSEVFDAVYRWMEAHVAGTDKSITTEPAVRTRPRTENREGPVETYPDLTAFQAPSTRYVLGQPTGFLKTGPMSPAGSSGTGSSGTWSQTITTNPTSSDAGLTMVTYSFEAFTGRPPTVWLPGVSRDSALVWHSEPLAAPARLRGSVRAHLNVVPKDAVGSVFGYLLEVDETGTGHLINYAPYTWSNATPGKAMAIDVTFDPTAYDIKSGRQLAFVVDGKDLMFLDENELGEAMTFTSSPGAGTWVDIPLRK